MIFPMCHMPPRRLGENQQHKLASRPPGSSGFRRNRHYPKNKEVELQKIPAPSSRCLERILSRAVMWSITSFEKKKRITDVFSFLLPLLGTHYSFPGPVPENEGGFRSPYHLPDTVTSFCPHDHAARQTLMSPLFRQGSQDFWLRAEVTQHLLWVSWPPVRG